VDTLDAEENVTIDALEYVVSFMGEAVGLFEQVSNGCKPKEPVIYNGKSKKGKIESLYYRYAKASFSLGNILAGLNLGKNPETTDDSAANGIASAEEKMMKLQQLTQILGIKDSKKESLDTKIMRDMIMSLSKGEGDLSGLLGALGDKMIMYLS